MLNAVRRTALLGAVLLLAGCGPKSDMPEVAPVRGKITLNGKPLIMAKVIFAPVEGGQSSEAVTNANGEYELVYKRDIMGAKIGKHKVMISTAEPPEVTDDGKVIGGKPELVPAQFNTQTTLEKEVTDGENVIDFTL